VPGEVVQDFPIQRPAQSPVGALAEGKLPPQRDPLRGLVDGVGLDVRAGERLVVVCARLDRHPAVQQQAVPIVVNVGGASQRLALGDLVHGRNRVPVKSQRVLAEGLHAERKRRRRRNRAPGTTSAGEAKPTASKAGRCRGLAGAALARRGGLDRGRRWGFANLERRIRQAVHPQHVAVGLNCGEQHFTGDG